MTNGLPIKPLSAVECIRPAVSRTEGMLFHPIRWARWWRLALLGLATGEAASQGGCNFNLPGGGDWSKIGDAGKSSPPSVPTMPHHVPGISDARIALIIAVLVVGIFALVIIHLYVSSVARFMLFDTIATGRQRLREGWKRWSSHGFRYFLFQILMIMLSMVLFVIMVGIPALIAWKAGVFSDFRNHWAFLLMELIVVVPIFLVVGLAAAVFGLFVKDFVVPIMALEDIPMADAIRKVWTMVKPAKGDYAIYVLMKIALAIGIGIGLAIIYVIFALIIIVPGVIAAVAIGVASPHWYQDPVMIALLITFILAAIIPILFMVGLIATPAVVFYQSYVLNFFGSRYAPLWVFMHPEGVPATAPSATPLGGGHEPPPYDIVPPEPTS